jgi:hypothetical protein
VSDTVGVSESLSPPLCSVLVSRDADSLVDASLPLDVGAWPVVEPGANAAEGFVESADVSGAAGVVAGAADERGAGFTDVGSDTVSGARRAVVGSESSLGSAGWTLVTGGATAVDGGFGACV